MSQDDWRVPLCPGTILNGEYVVRKCVSKDGGSCLLYDCYKTDSNDRSVEVYIKEFFPYEPKNAITRNEDGQLKWDVLSLVQKCQEITKFRDACIRLNEFYKKPDFGLSTSYQQDFFEENGTCYNVVAKQFAGVSGDKYENAKIIERILKLALKLTDVIGRYHKKGYLHLDIKPQNYLVANDGDDIIIQLFDLDSIVNCDETGKLIRGGEITYSPSSGYCAPDYINSGLIGTWTDIYSIGMVMLKLICGDGVIADDLDKELPQSTVFVDKKGEPINPAVQQKVKTILEHCLGLTTLIAPRQPTNYMMK